jgi:hypothetical protein
MEAVTVLLKMMTARQLARSQQRAALLAASHPSAEWGASPATHLVASSWSEEVAYQVGSLLGTAWQQHREGGHTRPAAFRKSTESEVVVAEEH